MAKRQFADDDTSKWLERYGLGGLGTVNESSGTDAPLDSAITGTSGTASCVGTNASFAPGQLVYIEQSMGGTASDINYEFNVITSYSAGAIGLKYPLTQTYVAGAQIIVINQNRIWSLNGATLTVKAWNGTVGGVAIRMASQSISGAGSIIGAGKGFIGGAGVGNNTSGKQGGGYPGSGQSSTTARNGNGAGGGEISNNPGAGGGNGAVGTAGTSGSGQPGAVAGTADLSSIQFGGAGASGDNHSGAGASGVGGNGGGKIILLAPDIDISGMTIVNAKGTDGTTSTGSDGSPGPGGGGAGGSILLKGQRIVLGTTIANATGGSGVSGGGHTSGNGGVGRIAVHYSQTITGTTTPSHNPTQDFVLNNLPSMILMF